MTTPPDAHGADDSPTRPTGAVPFPDAPGTGAVPFPTSPTGAVPFADQPGTAAPSFGDLPEMDAAPPLHPAGTHAPLPAPGYPPPGPGAPGAPPPDGQRRTGAAAIIALVTGLLGLVPVALLFGIGALVFRRRRNRAGKSFAVVGIAASLAWSAAAYLLLPVAAEALFRVERDESGEIRRAETTLFTLLRKGDCFTGYDSTEELRMVKAVPCTEPHTGEVILRTTLPDAPWPGDERVERAARVVCGSEIVRLRKSPRYPTLKPYYEVPNAVGWRLGRRQLICALHSDDELEGRLAGTVSKKVRTYEELARWNCIGKPVQGKHPHVSRVSCSKPHFAQVFATYEIEPDLGDHPLAYPAYPGPEVLEARVGNQCEALAVKTWPRPPGSGLRLFAIPPSPADWEVGIRTVVCTLTRPGENLRGSLAPR
ncbi:DUF4190 domain-containing protein [Actinomadura sp. WMMB 499]|uniref:DUF4190 domain-containing protein n=1 Tax=Actinomadura sp. WMMB 499 TaxID=1219491 RepID=UPI0012477405|nr:DUF4190 domain-containing protein [Actinomadura sp. WMMB 499]QFG25692.1 hypothetical protein F7P10_35655 [Actinomadura sp. WMMB 499]